VSVGTKEVCETRDSDGAKMERSGRQGVWVSTQDMIGDEQRTSKSTEMLKQIPSVHGVAPLNFL
jgi:hypothetical protein